MLWVLVSLLDDCFNLKEKVITRNIKVLIRNFEFDFKYNTDDLNVARVFQLYFDKHLYLLNIAEYLLLKEIESFQVNFLNFDF